MNKIAFKALSLSLLSFMVAASASAANLIVNANSSSSNRSQIQLVSAKNGGCGGSVSAWYSGTGKSVMVAFDSVQECSKVTFTSQIPGFTDEIKLDGEEGDYTAQLAPIPVKALQANQSHIRLSVHSNNPQAHNEDLTLILE